MEGVGRIGQSGVGVRIEGGREEWGYELVEKESKGAAVARVGRGDTATREFTP